MNIHPVRPEEYPAWLEMRQALWPDAELEELGAEQVEILAEPEQNGVFMAALPSGEPTGFIEVSLRHWAEGCSTHPVGYIEGWFVREAYRRNGIGGRLIAAAEDWAREQGCSEMGSDAEIWNEVSLQAHQALGYQEANRLVTFSKRLTDL